MQAEQLRERQRTLTNDRHRALTAGLRLDGEGLEVSPLYRPTVLKSEHKVLYTDCVSAEDSRSKHNGYDHADVMDFDFVWTPGKRLADCAPLGLKFDYAIASHVIEHVPNPVGWMLEILDVLKDGAVLSLAAPDKRFSFDLFRRETDCADLVDSWIRGDTVPTPRQIFDFLSRSIDGSGAAGTRAFELDMEFEQAQRHYTDAQALETAAHSWRTASYLDVHCSVFTPRGLYKTLNQINALGIMNVSISEPVENPDEFFLKLTKLGEPAIQRPVSEFDEKQNQRIMQLEADLARAREAFYDAVAIQDQLKSDLAFAR